MFFIDLKKKINDFDFYQLKKWSADYARLEPVNLLEKSFFRCFLLSKLTQKPSHLLGPWTGQKVDFSI